MKTGYWIIATIDPSKPRVEGARVAEVIAEDYADAYEQGVEHVKRWRAEARAEGRPFILRGGIQVLIRASGAMPAVNA